MEYNSKKIINCLKSDGWTLRNVIGSHHQFVKGGECITVPHPKKDLSSGVTRRIARVAGWK